MKCQTCNIDFSDSVYPLHIQRCKPIEYVMDTQTENPKIEESLTSPEPEEIQPVEPVEDTSKRKRGR